MELSGTAAFVTGGGRGIGREICLELASHGLAVCVADLDDSPREETVDRVEAAGGEAVEASLDLREPETVARAVETARSAVGPVDVLVNNAGIAGPTAPVEEVTLEAFEATHAVNLRGAFLCARELVGGMKERGYGRVVNVSSVSGKRAVPRRAPYTSSKAGLLGLTRTLAAEGGPHGVTANAVCPGSVSGPRIERVIEREAATAGREPEAVRAEKLADTLVESFVEAGGVAGLVAYLCSDDAAAVTGQAVNISGGKTIH